MTFESEWARCSPWLQAALSRSPDGYCLRAVEHEVRAHRATFWPLKDAAIVTEAWIDPEGRMEANVWLAGGSLRTLLRAAPEVEKRLRDTGYSAVSILGRKGWAKALKKMGWRMIDGELRKAL